MARRRKVDSKRSLARADVKAPVVIGVIERYLAFEGWHHITGRVVPQRDLDLGAVQRCEGISAKRWLGGCRDSMQILQELVIRGFVGVIACEIDVPGRTQESW